MKSSEIHNGLDKKEIRDFLSMQFVRLYEDEQQNQKMGIHVHYEDPFEWAIRDAEAQIVYLKRYIEINKSRQAVRQLIVANGWDEWDVSDETQNDLHTKLKMNFIGTKEEYDDLLRVIKYERKNGKN
jgi:hypothetical protein